MMDPEDVGLAGEVRCMAGAACLMARKTLVAEVKVSGLGEKMWACMGQGVWAQRQLHSYEPQNICPHRPHKLPPLNLRKHLMRPHHRRIREHDIQAPIILQRLIHHRFHGCFVRGIEMPCVDIDIRVEGVEFPLVYREELIAVVAEEDGAGAVLGELVRAGAADADGRVCAWGGGGRLGWLGEGEKAGWRRGTGDDDDFVLDSPTVGFWSIFEGQLQGAYLRPRRSSSNFFNWGEILESLGVVWGV